MQKSPNTPELNPCTFVIEMLAIPWRLGERLPCICQQRHVTKRNYHQRKCEESSCRISTRKLSASCEQPRRTFSIRLSTCIIIYIQDTSQESDSNIFSTCNSDVNNDVMVMFLAHALQCGIDQRRFAL